MCLFVFISAPTGHLDVRGRRRSQRQLAQRFGIVASHVVHEPEVEVFRHLAAVDATFDARRLVLMAASKAGRLRSVLAIPLFPEMYRRHPSARDDASEPGGSFCRREWVEPCGVTGFDIVRRQRHSILSWSSYPNAWHVGGGRSASAANDGVLRLRAVVAPEESLQCGNWDNAASSNLAAGELSP